jgi:carbamoyl-phosphate synthase large subunit
MTDSFNILLSSAGHRVERVKMLRATLAALGLEGRIITSDLSRLSAAGCAADAHEIVPRCSDAAFVPALLEVCRRHAVRLVIPGIDPELPTFAAAREHFAHSGTSALISSPETIDVGRDKRRTHAWLIANGFPTVQSAAMSEVLAQPATWTFPLFAKPAVGSASVGVRQVACAVELKKLAAELGDRQSDYLVQSIAPGIEYTVDVLVDRTGRCRCAVPRRRIEVRSGEVFKGVTAKLPPMMELASRIAEALPGAYGPLNVQMFHDAATGTTNVIEINPRFGGGYTLAWQAGARFPQWIIEELLGRPSTAAFDAWQDNLVMLRHYDAQFALGDRLGL